MNINHICGGAALAISFAANAGDATTLTFEEYNPPPEWGQFQQIGNILLTKGYSLTTELPDPFGFSSVDKTWRYNLRSTAITNNACSGGHRLTRGDNNPFAAKSIDLAEINGPGVAAVTFTGLRTDGTVTTRTVRTDGRAGWQRYTFPSSFSRLQSLSWPQADCVTNAMHMFDTIVLSGGEREDDR